MTRFLLAVVLVGLAPAAPSAAAASAFECAAGSSTCEAATLPAPRAVEEIEAAESAEVELMDMRLLQKRTQVSPVEAGAAKSRSAAAVEKAPLESSASDTGMPAALNQKEAVQAAEEETSSVSVSYDHNGHVCLLCGKPLAERLGGKNYTEFRADCGSHSSSTGPTVEALELPAAHFAGLKSSTGAATNGFCELNFAKSCADAIANEDYLYWAKSLDMLHPSMLEGRHYDARYCQLNGFLERDIVALQHNFTGMRSKAQELCETRYKKSGLETLTFKDMMARSRYEDPNAPSLEDAEALAAWNCAMGDLGCDMTMCAYSFCEDKKSAGTLGLYKECAGWDPVRGMPF